LLAVVVLLAPFFVVDIPAVLDYPNHLARLYILAHPQDPILSRMYAAHWSVLPNVGTDVIGATLLRFLPVHVAGRMLLALSLLAPFAGTLLYARAAFGRWTWWSLGAGAIGFNGIFFLGFMNFLLGVGVALAGAAAWRMLRRKGSLASAALAGAAIGVVAFFCHLFGLAYFALLIGAEEAEALLAQRRDGRLPRKEVVRTAALLAGVVGPAFLLYLFTHHSLQGGDTLLWRWPVKLIEWMMPFCGYDLRFTVLTACVLLLVGLAVARRARPAAGVPLALTALVFLYLVAPYQIAGGALVDARFPTMAAFLAFAGLDPDWSRRRGSVVAVALITLIIGRSAEAAVNWRGRAQDIADLRAALAFTGPGAKVLSSRNELPDGVLGGHGRTLSGFFRLDDNLPALMVIERRAFWPLLFADPSQQPIVDLAPCDQIAAASQASPPEWRDLADDPSPAIKQITPQLTDWRRRFDYILTLGPPPPALRGVSLVHAGAGASLYRIDR
jgi:hypothetical protein